MNGTDIIGLALAGMMAFVWWQVRKNQGSLKTALYQKDGIPVYITKNEYEKDKTKFEHTVCKQFEGIEKIVKDMDDKREVARKDAAIKWEAMSRALGRIEGKLSATG